MKNKKVFLFIGVFIVFLIGGFFINQNMITQRLEAFGLTPELFEKARADVASLSDVEKLEVEMTDYIENVTLEATEKIGITKEELLVEQDPDKPLYDQYTYVVDQKNAFVDEYNSNIQEQVDYAKSIDYKELVVDETLSLKEQLDTTTKSITDFKEKKVSALEKELLDLELSQEEVNKLKVDDFNKTLANMDTAIDEQTYLLEQQLLADQLEDEVQKQLNATATGDFTTSGGNFQTQYYQTVLNQTNAFRAENGLSALTYNYGMQSCVDSEAMAYANTNTPHNWVCPVANENASLASVNQDLVTISMDFFRTHPSHRDVLLGDYSSMTVSVVQQNGMNYLILGVF